MTSGKFIATLDGHITKIERLVESLTSCSFHPSKDQYETIGRLSLRLTEAATNLPRQIEALKEKRVKLAFENGEHFVAQVKSERIALTATTELKSPAIFARNITSFFFNGQQDSIVDSKTTKMRKQSTRERCQRICALSPDGLISWAVTLVPNIWTANLMSRDTFNYILEHIEPSVSQVWPPEIYRILNELGAKEPLKDSCQYHEFLKSKVYFRQKG